MDDIFVGTILALRLLSLRIYLVRLEFGDVKSIEALVVLFLDVTWDWDVTTTTAGGSVAAGDWAAEDDVQVPA
jgi:hypothetical protein